MTPAMAAIAYAPTQDELNRLAISGVIEVQVHKPLDARAKRLSARRLRNYHPTSAVPKLDSRMAEAEDRRLKKIEKMEANRGRATRVTPI